MATYTSRFRAAWLTLAAVAFLAADAARAETYGGIEIGGKGVKATVLDVSRTPAGLEVKTLLSDSENTAVTAGLAMTGRFDPAALKASAAAVAGFTERMRKEHKLPLERIHVVGSSGLFSAIEGNKEAVQRNQAAITEAVRAASGMGMAFISVERESELSIAGIVPADQAEASVLLDIGGGNTKGGCRTGRDRYLTFGVPFGTVTFADVARKQAMANTFAGQLTAARESVLAPALRKALDGKAELTKRETICLSGGAAWALAALIKPADRSSYVALSADDVKAFHALIGKAKGKFPAVDLSAIKDEKARAAAEKEIGKVVKALKPDHLQAGAEILLALSNEMRFEKARRVMFVRHSQVGWLLAYLLEKADAKQP
jgi:exopolyphosphatase/pppGpp-phosphohydrolase